MTRYSTSRDDKNGWIVQVRYDEGGIDIQSFKSLAEARTWIAAHRAHQAVGAKSVVEKR
jgi:hypothetical protein